MSQMLMISDELYSCLKTEASEEGYDSIERLLEDKHHRSRDGDTSATHQPNVFDRIEAFQRHTSAKYGMMPDSADLVREDRER